MGQREERSSSFLRQEQEALVPGGKQTKSKHIATSSFISSLRPKDQTPDFSSTEQSPNLGESFLLVYKADGTGNSRTGQSNLWGGWEGSWATDAAAFKLFVKNLLKHFARKNLYPPPPLMGGKGGSKMRTGDYFTAKHYTRLESENKSVEAEHSLSLSSLLLEGAPPGSIHTGPGVFVGHNCSLAIISWKVIHHSTHWKQT